MNKVKFVISLFVTIALTYTLHHPIPTEQLPIPPLGKLLNPYTGFWKNAEPVDANIKEEQVFSFLNLEKPVRVTYDDKMVPHIFAESLKDAITVQGYLEAKNRLWQMDFSTRATSGRISEVIGPLAINTDKSKRRMGLLMAAENTLKTWKSAPREYEIIEAYTKGVNAYIENLTPADYPLEFKILDYEPEPWTPLKSAIFMKAMAETLSSREVDLQSTNALNHFGREKFDYIYPERNDKESPIIPKSVKWNFESALNSEERAPSEPSLGTIYHTPFEKPAEFIGSNNWTVAGSKTANGKPILCNDPHLNLTLPAIWYEIQIHTPETNVYGVSLPGVPGVTIGFNENIAWGFTNVGHDIMDWYKIKWADNQKTTYYLDDQVMKTELKVERIKVRGQADILDTVRYTYWGPVSYESKDHPYQDLAMHWLVHEGKGNELTSFLGINTAKNFDDYYNGIRRFDNPAQNIAFASRDGDIALKVQGKFPIKAEEQGRFVQDGSTKATAWKGFIPFEQTPFVKNPEQGFVGSANQFSADTTYPYYYNGGFEDYRGRSLNQQLATMDDIAVQDMKDLQGSNYSIKAAEALPLMLGYLQAAELNAQEKELLKILASWDYNYDKEDTAPIIFDTLFREFYRQTWDEVFTVMEDNEIPFLYPESWRTIELLEKTPNDELFDDQTTADKKETAEDIVVASFKAIAAESENWKENGKFISWETYRNLKIPHLLNLPGFKSKFVSRGGSGDVLNAFNVRGGRAFGPSWKMIVELDDEVRAYGVYPAGQSGNPGSPYYDSMVETWASGDYYELIFMRNKNEEHERLLYSEVFE
ncbi:MAG: penicillin acylase family protein [Bacteroidota bacterium]